MRIYINNDWLFTKEFSLELLTKNYDTSNMENVRLPHSVVETPFNYFDESIYQMKCGYRKVFKKEEAWGNKRVLLTIEGAAHKAEVFINGISVITHECGYTAFTVDLTDYLLDENILVIYLDTNESLNQPPFGNVIDYMTYGGLYREVYLDIKENSYIEDVFTKTLSIKDGISFISEVEIFNNNNNYVIQQELYDINKNLICSFKENALKHDVKDLKLWDIDNPNLYYLKTILKGEKIIDEKWDRIGFRIVEFKSDGFYLNNNKIKIRGLNRHQSYPYVGYAMPKSMQKEDAKILKYDLGLNAVRTSHYPQSHHFINACDELGLLVFTEIPGWQHVGDASWKEKAIKNTFDMVKEYRNHPSIFLWGVRINESMDDDEFYKKTNEVAHKLDDSRPTSGVRFIQKSSLLEDVYSYNDFSHDGTSEGCLNKKKVTPDKKKGYLISEYNGHMFPTKSFDDEDHRVDHMLRHAKVLNKYHEYDDIAGGFGWCMADYNTHKDFGSGDRICYHGVLDMFRNPKLASYVYSSFKDDDIFLEISSMMDIGEHPACLSKDVYALTNADSVRVYKNDVFIKEFTGKDTPFKSLKHGPILIDDFIGKTIEEMEGFSHNKAEDVKKILLAVNKFGMTNLPFKTKLLAAKCILVRGLKMNDAVKLYYKYISNWGGTFTTYKFQAIKDGKVVKEVIRKPVINVDLSISVSHNDLKEENTYDVASIRIKAVDDNKNILPYYQEAVELEAEGPIEIIGPSVVTLRGGMGGTYIKTIGINGKAYLKISNEYIGKKTIEFNITGGINND